MGLTSLTFSGEVHSLRTLFPLFSVASTARHDPIAMLTVGSRVTSLLKPPLRKPARIGMSRLR